MSVGNEPTDPSPETPSASKSYLDIVREASAFDIEWLSDHRLQERQKVILTELPPPNELAKKIVQEIRKANEDGKIHAQINKTTHQPSNPRNLTRSILFEILSEKEVYLFFSKNPEGIETETRTESEVEKAITEFFKHPPVRDLVNSRKTDCVSVRMLNEDENSGEFVYSMTDTYEMKSSRFLNYRAFRQITATRKSNQKFVDVLNNLDTRMTDHFGLTKLGRGRKKMRIEPDMRQNLIMCRDVDTTKADKLIHRAEQSDGQTNRDGDFSDSDYAEFKAILEGRHPTIKIKLLKSSFSEKELDKLYREVLPLVMSILEI
ncbi:MAG: hypothetical protein UW41_C0037G0002 [Candidatus Collierbacteria bacterium GW2011_GWC2_44_18]|uniref:Uncharacterized protein n=2 Tax=Microgenomates group TaxID=1794810 RepID=A0A0G1J1X2_9BACT|nr:MAG: hypothetical protein UW16_C0045G0015 [Microgenomates group bacterium GW2011_GWC1_44_10]KKT48222.1 MAG: hypothetical protein UW41_C0037G0002 [Candidatus Collierbacteria bacterium GW2011_GWC2_44_18]KKT65581.1 MAG: hypothetical protein UW60_C0041G0002 [Candidatus Woesebacteria bacterium GW2011_GWA2_44_33]